MNAAPPDRVGQVWAPKTGEFVCKIVGRQRSEERFETVPLWRCEEGGFVSEPLLVAHYRRDLEAEHPQLALL